MLNVFVIVLNWVWAESVQLFFLLAGAEVNQAGESNYLRRGQLYLVLRVTLQDIRWRLQYSTVTFIFVEEDFCFIKICAVDELIDVSLRRQLFQYLRLCFEVSKIENFEIFIYPAYVKDTVKTLTLFNMGSHQSQNRLYQPKCLNPYIPNFPTDLF